MMIEIKVARSDVTCGTIVLLPSGDVRCTGVAEGMRGTVLGKSTPGKEFYERYRSWSNGYMYAREK